MGLEKWSYVKYFMFVYSVASTKDSNMLMNLGKLGKGKQPDNIKVKEKLLDMENVNGLRKGNNIYVHIPFCVSICEYCMWYKIHYNRSKLTDYLDSLYKEINMVAKSNYAKSTKFDSIYIGGGTPSTLSVDDIKTLFNNLNESFSLTDDCEITFEANTSSLTKEKIQTLKLCGVTRISLGIQTFDEKRLSKMECAHKVKQVKEVVDIILKEGFTLNLDLIYGYMEQNEIEWRRDLEELCKIRPQQVTLYPLRIFPGSKLHKEYNRDGNFNYERHQERIRALKKIADEMLTADIYRKGQFAFSYLRKDSTPLKYIAIETRNINLGASAGGFSDIGETRNIYDVDKYIQLVNMGILPADGEVSLTKQQIYERFIFMSIVYGNKDVIDFKAVIEGRFKDFFGEDISKNLFEAVSTEMEKYGMIEMNNGEIKTTSRLWEYVDNSVLLY
jgi:oxygen-independent coproporphyrinogen-3 oxidase